MVRWRADLHVHTCLSPCGELEMSPTAIVRQALHRGLGVIAICDHNTAGCVRAVAEAAARLNGEGGGEAGTALVVVPGIEVTTREEVHVLGLFAEVAAAERVGEYVGEHLAGVNDAELFGLQVEMDAHDRPVAVWDDLLIGATDLSLSTVVRAIHTAGGWAVAAHVDRERFGLLGQLGFVPPGLALDALEHSPRTPRAEALQRFGEGGRWPMLCGSDAHQLSAIGAGGCVLEVSEASPWAVGWALRGERGCAVCG